MSTSKTPSETLPPHPTDAELRAVLERVANQRVFQSRTDGEHYVMIVSEDVGGITDPKSAHYLHTCHLRGWVEIVPNAIGISHVTVAEQSRGPKGEKPDHINEANPMFPVYRLTEAGWHVIRQTHWWVVATFWVAIASLIASLVGVAVTVAVSQSG